VNAHELDGICPRVAKILLPANHAKLTRIKKWRFSKAPESRRLRNRRSLGFPIRVHSPCSRLNFSSGGTIIPAIRGSNPMQYSPVVLPNLRLFHLRQFSHAKSGNLFTFVQLLL
jgi:hypothetical protein